MARSAIQFRQKNRRRPLATKFEAPGYPISPGILDIADAVIEQRSVRRHCRF
jgi:hypothetical protein